MKKIKCLALLFFLSLLLCSPIYADNGEDGWDGTENTPNSPNDEPPVDGWGDLEGSSYDVDNYCTVTDSDGNIVSLGYDDVYDEYGNAKYTCDDPDAQSRVYEFFADEHASRVYGTSDELLGKYHDAQMAYLNAMKTAVPPVNLDSLKAAVEQAKSELINFCTKANFTWEAKGNSMAIYDANHKTVSYIGDPVNLATGKFIIDDTDVSLSSGRSVFNVERHFIEIAPFPNAVKSATCERKYGAFGRNWYSNLDSRIIRGYKEGVPKEKVEQLENYLKNLKEAEEELKNYVEEEKKEYKNQPSAEFLAKIQQEIPGVEKNLAMCRFFYEGSSENPSLNRFVEYGNCASYAGRIGADSIIYCGDDDMFILLSKNAKGEYVDDSAYWKGRLKVTETEDGGFCVEILKTGEKRFYSKFGLPARYETADGSKISFVYDSSSVLSEIVVNGSRRLKLKWSGGLVSSISDGVRTVTYSYSGGCLVSVTDWEKDTKRYEYDYEGSLVKQTKPDKSYVTITYAKVSGKKLVKSITDETGATEKFSFDLLNQFTVYTDPDGVKTLYMYDKFNRTIGVVYSDSTKEAWAYGSDGKIKNWVDGTHFVNYEYDTSGEISKITDDKGNTETFRYSNGRITSHKDRNNCETKYYYKDNGILSSVYVNGKTLVRFNSNNQKQITSVLDCHGKSVSFFYDENGDVEEMAWGTSYLQGSVLREKWTYDAGGRVSSHTDKCGVRWDYSYSPHKLVMTGSNSVKVTAEFSPRKLMVSKEVLDLVTGERRTRYFDYDRRGRCTAEYIAGVGTDGTNYPKELVKSWKYTAAGKVSEVKEWNSYCDGEINPKTDFASLVRKYQYGPTGDMAMAVTGLEYENQSFDEFESTSFWRTPGVEETILEVKNDNIERKLVYDMSENLLEVNQNGRQLLKKEYSDSGKLLSLKKAPDAEFSFSYDSQTNYFSGLAEEGGERREKNKVDFYPDGKLKSSEDSNGIVTEYSYDVRGNLIQIHDPSKTRHYIYDGNDRIAEKRIEDASGKVLYVEKWISSDNGRTVRHETGEKYFEILTLNGFGEIVARRTSDTDRSAETLLQYDVFGRLVAQKSPEGHRTSYFYNGNNQLTRIVFPDGSFKDYTYDKKSNCLQVSDAKGIAVQRNFDSYGNISGQKKRGEDRWSEFERDDSGRFLKITKPGKQIRFEYDDDARKQIRSDGTGKKDEFVYDSFGRLLSWSNRQGQTSRFYWDKNGLLSRRTDFNGNSADYEWSPDKLYCMVKYSDGTFISTRYDAAGNLIEAENESSKICYGYDSGGKLTYQYDGADDSKVYYSYDSAGNFDRITGEGREISYSYDKSGRVCKIAENVQESGQSVHYEVTFEYDSMGREILCRWNDGTYMKTVYDANGMMKWRAAYSGMTLLYAEGHIYDSDGRKKLSLDTSFSVTKYQYDDYGRIVKVEYPYSDEKDQELKKMSEEAGVYTLSRNQNYHPLNVDSSDNAQLLNLCHEIGGSKAQISAFPEVLFEEFSYDSNSNLVRRSSPYGKITYKYDSYDRLLSWGNGCSAKYDANGNLTALTDRFRQVEFAYDMTNRMKSACIKDFIEDEQKLYTFLYDPLGRRFCTELSSGGKNKTVFAGFSMNPIVIRKAFKLNSFDSAVDGSPALKNRDFDVNSVRYRWDDFSEENRTGKLGFDIDSPNDRFSEGNDSYFRGYFDESISEKENGQEESFEMLAPLFNFNGKILSLSELTPSGKLENHKIFSDAQNTVKAALSDSGISRQFEYTATGRPAGERSFFGYLGKRFCNLLGFYDFGQRDYSPDALRFTTVDPIYYGENWYSYCEGDFVNFVDKYGCDLVVVDAQYMQSMGDGTMLGNSNGGIYCEEDEYGNPYIVDKNEYADKEGCFVTAIAEALTALTGVEVDPSFINGVSSNFVENSAMIDWSGILSNYGLEHQSFTKENLIENLLGGIGLKAAQKIEGLIRYSPDKTKLDLEHSDIYAETISDFINSIMDNALDVVVTACVTYDPAHPNNTHMVSVAGGVFTAKDGIAYVPITPTSVNDTAKPGSKRYNAGWREIGNRICVPVSLISRMDTMKKNN